jgi:hypothetical protein
VTILFNVGAFVIKPNLLGIRSAAPVWLFVKRGFFCRFIVYAGLTREYSNLGLPSGHAPLDGFSLSLCGSACFLDHICASSLTLETAPPVFVKGVSQIFELLPKCAEFHHIGIVKVLQTRPSGPPIQV